MFYDLLYIVIFVCTVLFTVIGAIAGTVIYKRKNLKLLTGFFLGGFTGTIFSLACTPIYLWSMFNLF
jgi:RsiW-degrading membrane proteinase PrsW (M82 family)